MDPIHTLVRHLGRARYDELSAEVVGAVKMTILDAMGAALAGSASEAGRGIARIAKGYGGGAGSTVVVHGGKVAPPLAVLANGVMARCRELDGTHEVGGGHGRRIEAIDGVTELTTGAVLGGFGISRALRRPAQN